MHTYEHSHAHIHTQTSTETHPNQATNAHVHTHTHTPSRRRTMCARRRSSVLAPRLSDYRLPRRACWSANGDRFSDLQNGRTGQSARRPDVGTNATELSRTVRQELVGATAAADRPRVLISSGRLSRLGRSVCRGGAVTDCGSLKRWIRGASFFDSACRPAGWQR